MCYLVTKLYPTVCDPMGCSLIGSSVHGISQMRILAFPGENTGVGCHFLVQGIFPTQGSNPHLLNWQEESLLLSHEGSPKNRIQNWISVWSQFYKNGIIPVHQTQASCILHQTWTGDSFLIWYTCFNAILQNHPPPPSPTKSKRLFYTSVSLLLSHIQGYRYHLPKFHIYVLVYRIGVFLSGLLHSV